MSKTDAETSLVSVGDTAEFSTQVTAETVETFAEASGDTNPIHLDDDAAAESRFGERIAHGMLGAGFISAALNQMQPGRVIYLAQNLRFQAPVYLGDHVTAQVEVTEALGGDRYEVSTVVSTENGDVITGSAEVLIQ